MVKLPAMAMLNSPRWMMLPSAPPAVALGYGFAPGAAQPVVFSSDGMAP
jgi:hypothetical protein